MLYLRILWVAGTSIHTGHLVLSTPLHKGSLAIFANKSTCLGTVAEELVVAELVFESQDAFATVVALVTLLVGTGLILLVAEDSRPS